MSTTTDRTEAAAEAAAEAAGAAYQAAAKDAQLARDAAEAAESTAEAARQAYFDACLSTTDQPQPVNLARLRAELADLTLHATDRQLGAVLREWAADTDFNSAPLMAMAVLIGMVRGTIVRDGKK